MLVVFCNNQQQRHEVLHNISGFRDLKILCPVLKVRPTSSHIKTLLTQNLCHLTSIQHFSPQRMQRTCS